MEYIFFWIIWGITSFWVLKTFYFSYHKEKLNRLCKTALGIDLSILILFFLPWIPGGQTGWQLILQGNFLVILLGIFISISLLCFFIKNKLLLILGAILHMISSLVFMIRLLPGTYSLTFDASAPIFASLLLLVGNVVVLLMWQQLQLKVAKKR